MTAAEEDDEEEEESESVSSPSRRLVGRTRKQVMLMYKQRQVAPTMLQQSHLQLCYNSPLIALICAARRSS